MNHYRCETCKDILCKCNPKQEGIQFSPNWIFTRRYGCASHIEFKIDRDEVLSEWATCIHNCDHIHCLGRYNEIVAGYRKSDQDGEV